MRLSLDPLPPKTYFLHVLSLPNYLLGYARTYEAPKKADQQKSRGDLFHERNKDPVFGTARI